MSAPIIITCAVVAVVSVPLILLWWKVADQWADAEHKRFPRGKQHRGPAPTVVRRFDEGMEPMEDRRTP